MLMMAKLITMTFILTIFTIIDDQNDDFDYTTLNFYHGHGNDFKLGLFDTEGYSLGMVGGF